MVMALTMFYVAKATPVASQAPRNRGTIWTTNLGCGGQQDVNHYAHGATVSIQGANFLPNSQHSWQITGQPGQASCDPHQIVASGTVLADADGGFCVNPAYTVNFDDCGEYTVDVTDSHKNDNYRVDEDVKPSPSPTISPTPTASPSPTISPMPEVSPSPEVSPTPQISPLPEVSPTPQVSPSPVASPTPSGTPQPGHNTSLANDNLQCGNKTFDAVMDVKDNDQAIKDVLVKFTYNGETKEARTNENGRAKVTFEPKVEGTVTATADGYPSQSMYIKLPADCSVVVLDPNRKHGQVLGATTLADTGTAVDQLLVTTIMAGVFMIAGGFYGLTKRQV